MDQNEIRRKYIERIKRERQVYISDVVGISSSMLTLFKQGRVNLHPADLKRLTDYLDGKYDTGSI